MLKQMFDGNENEYVKRKQKWKNIFISFAFMCNVEQTFAF